MTAKQIIPHWYLKNPNLKIISQNTTLTVVAETFRAQPLYLAHHIPIGGHPGQRRRYDTLQQEYYWLHIENEVYTIVTHCMSSAKNGSQYKHKRQFQPFPSCGPLKYVLQIAWAVETALESATKVANVYLGHWIFLSDTPSYVLIDTGPQFISKLCATIRDSQESTVWQRPHKTHYQTFKLSGTIRTLLPG